MSTQYASNVDLRGSNFHKAGRDIYNIVAQVRPAETMQEILKSLDPARMDPSKRPECLAETRTDILKYVVDWATAPRVKQNVLWLHGLAGSGKSTLSTTIASHFREEGRLGAFLFFARDVTERNNPTAVVRTLAYQLGTFHPEIGHAIAAFIRSTPSICLSPLPFQFRRLLIDPLSSFATPRTPIVLVFDALDHCGTPNDRDSLMRVLSELSGRLPPAFRFIITSRAEIDICRAFDPGSHPHILSRELDITSQANTNDIASYFRHGMAIVRKNNQRLRLGADWPGEGIIQELTERASGLFIWASTALEFIDGYDPRVCLDTILKGEVATAAQAALDALYETALESEGIWDDKDFVADFHAILGLVLVAQTPLSCSDIDRLLGKRRSCPTEHTVSRLGCVLQRTPTVRVLHSSFADFLLTRSRCGRDVWCFDPVPHHRSLAVQCVHRLNEVLKYNMCDLTLSKDLGLSAKSGLPEDISYACKFWVEHICTIKDGIESIMELLKSFLYRHLLHWFEAMSILRRSRDTIASLRSLSNWITNNHSEHYRLLKFVRDALRFAQTFASSIEEHPLLVYRTALPFAPAASAVYKTFHDAVLFPFISGGFQQSWSALLLVLPGHQAVVTSVAFSPDGTKIISGSGDKTVRVWDATSGAEVLPALHHEDVVSSVTFSPDGKRIVSGSWDGAIRVWDAASGADALPGLRWHEEAVTSVACSPNGRIVSSSYDDTVRVWNAASGKQVFSALRGHDKAVTTVAVSPDGTYIASGSADKTVRVWDATAELLRAMRGHEKAVTSVAFSPDGTHIVSGSEDKTVRIWDAISGVEVLPTLRGHEEEVTSVAFSPHGTHIASGSEDKTVRVWNRSSGMEVLTLRGHDQSVHSVAFSPGGTYLVSGSRDQTVRVWYDDATSNGELLSAVRGPCYRMNSVAFSAHGAHVVSGSDDKTVRVWDVTSGDEVVPAMRGHERGVWSVAFSPDGTHIVSGSEDKTVRVWNTSSGMEVLTLRGHTDAVELVSFSHDGRRIISQSRSENISWDAIIGRRLPLNEKPDPVSLSTLYTTDGWIVDSATDSTLCKLPTILSGTCSAVCGRSLAVGTSDGRLLVVHFPPSLFEGSDTRVAKGRRST